MDSLLSIGSALIAWRQAQGVTQSELGRRLGVSQPQVARWERDDYRSISLARLALVADALCWSPVAAAQPNAAESAVEYRTALPGAEPDALVAYARLGVPEGALAAFARSHHIERLALFGSILTDRFTPASDVDVLVTYGEGNTPSLFELADHETEFSAILRRRVDLVVRGGVEASSNPIRRREILDSAKTLYARP
ncbi:MAG: XRE family transcriptional regulator [Coriobacteriia bacterium]|nr:XRE family transcriptional regulator [Coriobacteriia bacterium]